MPWPPPGTAAIEVDDFYDDLAAQGYNYGRHSKVCNGYGVTTPPDVIYAEVELPEDTTSTATASTRPIRRRFTPPTRPDPTPTNDTDDTNTADTVTRCGCPTPLPASVCTPPTPPDCGYG
ncbi:putative type I polyketide synthase [Mycobacterium ulcerans str. Harvey]|uniref:Type I polyketide synthase n=1 Tax=Mycobacterium ulcerans str. Harvey TaxID=1299332 RepID=A0ABN0RAX1_MYCUL|nr:putative type I polyketide synthase [Mycobacterium ulcerans str. Harvey]